MTRYCSSPLRSLRQRLDDFFGNKMNSLHLYLRLCFFISVIVALTLGQTQGRGGETSEGARFEASEGHRLCRLLNLLQIPSSASCFSTMYCNDGIHISFHLNLHGKNVLFFSNTNPCCSTSMLKHTYCIWVSQPLSSKPEPVPSSSQLLIKRWNLLSGYC